MAAIGLARVAVFRSGGLWLLGRVAGLLVRHLTLAVLLLVSSLVTSAVIVVVQNRKVSRAKSG